MSQKNGLAVPELIACMVSIIWAEVEYVEGAWMHYNVAYCQQAAEYWNTTWSKVTPHGSHYALQVRLKP